MKKQSKKHIVFIHLLNDYSGSPGVLAQVINALPDGEYEKTLFVSNSSKDGFLSNLKNVETKLYWYRWMASNWMRLITYSISQFLLFFYLLKYFRKDITIYINTLLPFGAGLAAKLMNKKIIYHIHETTIRPQILKKVLVWVAEKSAAKAIYVSNYLRGVIELKNVESKIVHNALSNDFTYQADAYLKESKKQKENLVVMICSLKSYKGIVEFVEIAKQLKNINFELVLNANMNEVNQFKASQNIPINLSVFSAQKNVHDFYQRAKIVLNLSNPTVWIETFGMTILEAMYYNIPVIAPNIGGPTELIENQKNGYLINVDELNKIINRIETLMVDDELYNKISLAAKTKANEFSTIQFQEKAKYLINNI